MDINNIMEEQSYLKVDGHKDLVRDKNSRAIINTNRKEYLNYMRKVNNIEKQKREIDSLKQDVSEIKNLLKQLLERQ